MVFDVEVILFPRGQDKRLSAEVDLKDEGRDEVRTKTTLLVHRTRYKAGLRWFIWLVTIHGFDTTENQNFGFASRTPNQIGWFIWFGTVQCADTA